jgi:hypothetical protein
MVVWESTSCGSQRDMCRLGRWLEVSQPFITAQRRDPTFSNRMDAESVFLDAGGGVSGGGGGGEGGIPPQGTANTLSAFRSKCGTDGATRPQISFAQTHQRKGKTKTKKAKKKILRVTFKWRRINTKVGGNFENKFPTPFFEQEKSSRKVLRVTIIRKNGGT